MDTDRVRAIIADILGVDAGSIRATSSMNNTGAWDSIAHINIIAAIEQEFGIYFEVEEMERMTSFTDMVSLIETKL